MHDEGRICASASRLDTVETYEGKRLQKFNYKGVGAVPQTTN